MSIENIEHLIDQFGNDLERDSSACTYDGISLSAASVGDILATFQNAESCLKRADSIAITGDINSTESMQHALGLHPQLINIIQPGVIKSKSPGSVLQLAFAKAKSGNLLFPNSRSRQNYLAIQEEVNHLQNSNPALLRPELDFQFNIFKCACFLCALDAVILNESSENIVRQAASFMAVPNPKGSQSGCLIFALFCPAIYMAYSMLM